MPCLKSLGAGLHSLIITVMCALDVLHIRFPPSGVEASLVGAPAPKRDSFNSNPMEPLLTLQKPLASGTTANGQGVAIGDVDNDGDVDVYVTNLRCRCFLSKQR